MHASPLIPYFFDRQTHLLGQAHVLRQPLAEWLSASPRFAAFAERYKDKIRKKIRVLNGDEMALDLLAELETACLLLAEKGLELTYEPYAGEKRRGADFTALWRASVAFNVEVTRLRSGAEPEARLADMVCEKFGQLQPGMINLLAVAGSDLPPLDVAGAMQRLKLAAETRSPALYARQGYRAPADFFKGYERLSAVLLRQGASLPAQLWDNPQARRPIPGRLHSLLARLFGCVSGE